MGINRPTEPLSTMASAVFTSLSSPSGWDTYLDSLDTVRRDALSHALSHILAFLTMTSTSVQNPLVRNKCRKTGSRPQQNNIPPQNIPFQAYNSYKTKFLNESFKFQINSA